MNTDEIIQLIDEKIGGQGTQVDASGALPTILKELATREDIVERHFKILDFTQTLDITLPAVTSDTPNTSIPNVDVKVADADKEKYMIVGLLKFEITGENGRVNATPVTTFTMEQQTVLRCRFMVAGTQPIPVTKIQGFALLLLRGTE